VKAWLIVAVLATAAHADNKSDADALFKKAKKLHADKKYADACPMFEKSDKLDSGIGAKLNVAKCYEDWGMLARAYRWYTDAEAMARDAKDKRARKIKDLLEGLDSDVPRLTLKAPDGVDANTLAIEVDGKPIDAGTEMRVDPGPHEITWRANGKTKSKTIAMERGGERELTLDVRPAATDKVVVRTDDERGEPMPSTPSRPGRGRRIIGISIGAAGLVGLGVASYLTLDARSTYNDALDAHCMGATDMCSDEGLRLTGDARSQANLATVVTIASLVVLAGGVVLYLTAPSGKPEANRSALYVAPVVGGDAGGIVFGGGF
jgi:hypothetical protein